MTIWLNGKIKIGDDEPNSLWNKAVQCTAGELNPSPVHVPDGDVKMVMRHAWQETTHAHRMQAGPYTSVPA